MYRSPTEAVLAPGDAIVVEDAGNNEVNALPPSLRLKEGGLLAVFC